LTIYTNIPRITAAGTGHIGTMVTTKTVEVKVNVLERNVTVMIVILGNCVTQNVMAMETVSMEYVVV
jgi:type III secretion system FlhB-like substrate exporter